MKPDLVVCTRRGKQPPSWTGVALSMALAAFSAFGPVAAQAPETTEGPIASTGLVAGYTVDSARNHSINTYFLIGERGVTVVDALWRPSEARRALAHLRTLSDKPITDILITHPHTDHYGGIGVFVTAAAPDVRIHATEIALRDMKHDTLGFNANRRDDFKDDFPSQAELPLPNRLLTDGQELDLNGIRVRVATFRSNEATEAAVFWLPAQGALFTGDIVNNRTSPVFYQGSIDGWIEQLHDLRTRFAEARTIYPGHGQPGPAAELIRAESDYLSTFRNLVSNEILEHGTVTPEGQERIAQAVQARFPGWRTTAGVPDVRRLIGLNTQWVLRGWRIKEASGAANPREFRQAPSTSQ